MNTTSFEGVGVEMFDKGSTSKMSSRKNFICVQELCTIELKEFYKVASHEGMPLVDHLDIPT